MFASRNVRVLAVDDHPLLRSGICAAISSQQGMCVVAEAETGEQAVTAYKEHRPDVTLMDLRMPGMGGVAAISAIKEISRAARIVVLTTYGGDVQAVRALKAGASGYLLKSMLRTDLIDTIRLVHAGHKRMPPEIASAIAEHAAEDALTTREVDVLRSAAGGRSNKRIADDLAVSEHTVKGHIRNILAKLGASDRTHAVVMALKRGILE